MEGIRQLKLLETLKRAKHHAMNTNSTRTTNWWDATVNGIIQSPLMLDSFRNGALSALGVSVDSTADISRNAFFRGPGPRVGARSYIGDLCVIDRNVTIGSDVALAPRVSIMTFTHAIGGSLKRWGPHTVAPVVIGDGSWVGMDVVICPGVTIGTGCVIAAGAVVIEDTDPNWLYAGIPARRIRPLS